MAENKDFASLRKKKRYSHASIRLRMKIGDEWKSIRALDWNDRGFNFFTDVEINDVSMTFKKDTKQFEGAITWCFMKDDKRALIDTMLNTLIFKRLEELKDHGSKDDLKKALLTIRSHENTEDKKKFLESMGVDLTKKNMEVMLEGFSEQHSLYQYGVHAESEYWVNTVNSVFKDTKDMIDMDAAGEKLLSAMDKLTLK